MHKIKLKRIYDKVETDDGMRILVDRLWPRGVSKAEAKIDLWLKDVAPSDELRKHFNHEPEKWPEFKKLYIHELKDKRDIIENIKNALKKGDVTLLFSAKDEERNNAVVLKEYLSRH